MRQYIKKEAMRSRKQQLQHRREVNKISRVMVKESSRKIIVEQDWRADTTDWSTERVASGNRSPRTEVDFIDYMVYFSD